MTIKGDDKYNQAMAEIGAGSQETGAMSQNNSRKIVEEEPAESRGVSVTPGTAFYSPRLWLIYGIAVVIGISLGSCFDPVLERKAIEQPVYPQINTDGHR